MNFIKTIIKNRKLAIQLGKNDFRNRFASTSLGAVWGFLQPFVFMMMYVIIFQFIFGMAGDNGSPYVVWFLPGMAVWQCLNDSIMSASSSIINYSYLVKKVVFPVDIIPVISITSSSIIGMFLIYIATMAATAFGYFPNLLNLIYIVFCAFCFIISFTRFTSALTTLVPDFSQLLNIVMQLCMWFTPIIWNLNMINGPMSIIFKAFPFTYLVEGFRQAFTSTSTIITQHNGLYTIIFWIITIIIYAWGNSVFKKSKKDFADVL